MKDVSTEWLDSMERLIEAVESLEDALQSTGSQMAAAGSAEEIAGRIVATVESEREMELQRRLDAAEQKIAELSLAASAAGRRTVSAGAATMVAKHGVLLENVDAGSLDTALASLSVEQRIAVKAELLRSGAIG